MARGRRSNGEGSAPYRLPDGRWRSELTVGWSSEGRRIRKIIYGPTEAECRRKLRAAIRAREDGSLVLGKSPTLSAWMDYWVEEIVAPAREPQTTQGYRSKIRQYVAGSPSAGVRLDALTPEDLDAIYSGMRARNLSTSTILQMHRILARALKVAVQRGRLGSNPAARMDPPGDSSRAPEFSGRPLSIQEARRLVAAAAALPDGAGAGWLLNLAFGPRQGERLALGWDMLDLDAGVMRIERTLQPVRYRHGCADAPCGRRAHLCPAREGGGLYFGGPKSSAGWRSIVLPEQLISVLREHRAAQEARRALVGGWEPYTDPAGVTVDLVWCQDNGRPIGGRTDWGRWKAFLRSEGVEPVRVHDGRHTAATVLLLMGVEPRVVMEIMGWSQPAMLSRYQHVLDEMKRSAAVAVGSALFSPPGPPAGGGGGNVVSVDFAGRRRA